MDYLLTQEEIYNTIHKIPMSKYAIILKSTKNEYQYNHQVKIMERHALLEAQLEKVQGMIADMEAECEARLKEQSVIHSMQLEQLNTKYEKMQEWYDAALDWREMEIQRARKETARNMLDDILKNKFTVESMIRNRNGHREVVDVVIIRLIKNDIVDLKSKYGIEE